VFIEFEKRRTVGKSERATRTASAWHGAKMSALHTTALNATTSLHARADRSDGYRSGSFGATDI